jgi:hypothetical protein
MTILEFADIVKHKIIITYYPNQDCRFSASFEHGEVINGGCLVGEYGTSDNPEGAINDYVAKIQGKDLAFNAMTTNRQEFSVPKSIEMIGE